MLCSYVILFLKIKKMPAISIIIPVYNTKTYLKQCLDSVINQTFKDIEIICIDDGSTDGSLDILQKYAEKDNRFVILTQEHKGAGEARNKGMNIAKAKYIQFLDSDDWFELDMLGNMYINAEKYSTDIIVCSSRKVNDSGNIIEKDNPNNPINLTITPINKVFCAREFKQDIFTLLTPILWNKLYLTDFLRSNNIKFSKLKIYEDVPFVHSSVICADKIFVLNKEFVNYRYNREGSLANLRSTKTIDVVTSCIELKQFLEQKNLFNEFENAYNLALKNHILSEISFCNEEQYKNFMTELKELIPNDWHKLQSSIRYDYITLDYLYKIIGNKRVMLWGASLFIKHILEKEEKPFKNILGIIDKNSGSWGKMCGNYKIYPPEILNDLKPDGIILTVLSNNENIYKNLKQEIKYKYPKIELMNNIFYSNVVK